MSARATQSMVEGKAGSLYEQPYLETETDLNDKINRYFKDSLFGEAVRVAGYLSGEKYRGRSKNKPSKSPRADGVTIKSL